MRIEPLAEGNARAWAALFDAAGCTCFCRWWHFDGTKNEWLARCFHEPEANRDEQLALVRAGAPEARGLLALEDEDARGAPPVALGWMKLAPRALLPKLRTRGPYRAIDLGSDAGVWSIGCLLVHPAHRRRGVARALVGAAADHVRAWGGRAIEAYPHRVDHPQHDEEAWMGPESVFVEAGFEAVAGESAYPVLRKSLGVVSE